MGAGPSVAVVGAGPYGLSVAAHLTAAGLRPRIFGCSMETWRSFMPNGMILKSEGFAMNLSDPSGAYPLEAFCADRGIPYQAVGWPVPVEVFADYGVAFQKRFAPQIEAPSVTHVAPSDDGFALTLSSGERFEMAHVILATGIRPYARPAPVFAQLPADRVSHSANQGDMARFRGQRVAVLGGGASAMDVAAALHRRGASAIAITHRPEVRFYSPNGFRDRFMSPLTPLGPGWKKQLCVKFPDLFHALPRQVRVKLIASYLGPSPAWSVRELIEEYVDLRLSTELTHACVENGSVRLTLDTPGGPEFVEVDHVIAATGYAIDADRLAFLAPSIRAILKQDGEALRLTSQFETRVPGLFMVGTPAAPSFGPLLRFVCGTAFAAQRTTAGVLRREGMRRWSSSADDAASGAIAQGLARRAA